MAHTDITLIHNGGNFVPSAARVQIVSGDTVSFATSDGTPVVLFFSPDAAAILTPAPAKPFPIAPKGKAVFAFSSSSPGAHSVLFRRDSNSAPSSFPSETSLELLLEAGSMLAKPSAQDNIMRPGS
jgi:hypothetical protein